MNGFTIEGNALTVAEQNKICFKCKGIKIDCTTLYGCRSSDCNRYIHEGCLIANEFEEVQHSNEWVCSETCKEKSPVTPAPQQNAQIFNAELERWKSEALEMRKSNMELLKVMEELRLAFATAQDHSRVLLAQHQSFSLASTTRTAFTELTPFGWALSYSANKDLTSNASMHSVSPKSDEIANKNCLSNETQAERNIGKDRSKPGDHDTVKCVELQQRKVLSNDSRFWSSAKVRPMKSRSSRFVTKGQPHVEPCETTNVKLVEKSNQLTRSDPQMRHVLSRNHATASLARIEVGKRNQRPHRARLKVASINASYHDTRIMHPTTCDSHEPREQRSLFQVVPALMQGIDGWCQHDVTIFIDTGSYQTSFSDITTLN